MATMSPLLRQAVGWLLRLIGVALFVWILLRIDRNAILTHIRESDLPLLLASFGLLILFYIVKVVRWHFLVRTAGIFPSFSVSWKVYNAGIFLGTITPGKVGELGRAAYLRREGLDTGTSLLIVILDRVADAIIVAILAVGAIGMLFGAKWLLISVLSAGVFFLAFLFMARQLRNKSLRHAWMRLLRDLLWKPRLLLPLLVITTVSWGIYSLWASLLAQSLGINVPLLLLISIIILTGVVSLLPIAPTGLGTRDAALIAMLVPFGVPPSQAVALSLLMFVSIIASSLIGGWYWVRGLPRKLSPA